MTLDRLISPLRLNCHPSERRVLIIGLLCLVLVGGILRLYTAWWYDPFTQHDPNIHFASIKQLLGLCVCKSYNAPFYYMFIVAITLPFSVLFRIGLLSDTVYMTIVVSTTNILFQSIYMYGCLLLARQLRFRLSTQLMFVGLCVFLPPVQRSFSMIRPEILLLTLTPFACSYFLIIFRCLRGSIPIMQIPSVIPLLGVVALMAAQKVTGVILAAGLGSILFACTPGSLWLRLKKLSGAILIFCTLFIVLSTVHQSISGKWLFEHHGLERAEYQVVPPVSVFTSFDIFKAWENPFRNSHADSMMNILLIDLFGDYWRYGYDHYRFEGRPTEDRLMRARAGILASLAFFSIYFVAAAFLGRSLLGTENELVYGRFLERTILSSLTILGLGFLILVSFYQFNPGKFDIVKWEYIIPYVPFLMIPMAHLSNEVEEGFWRKLVNTMLVLIIFSGLIQSIRFPV